MAIVPFLADTIKSQIGLDEALIQAANQYGKTITEAELEQQIQAELLIVKESKERIVKAIASGLIVDDEAKAQLDDLRAKEQRLNQDLATIGEKEQIRLDYLEAVEILQSQDIERTLWNMLENNQNALKRLTKMILASFTIKVIGKLRSRTAKGEIDTYQLTEQSRTFCDESCASRRR